MKKSIYLNDDVKKVFYGLLSYLALMFIGLIMIIIYLRNIKYEVYPAELKELKRDTIDCYIKRNGKWIQSKVIHEYYGD